MPACLSKFRKEITIEEMKKVNEKMQKQTEEMKLEIEEIKLKIVKLENEELDRFLLIEDMKYANDEIHHLVKEDQKIFEYYDEELRCFHGQSSSSTKYTQVGSSYSAIFKKNL